MVKVQYQELGLQGHFLPIYCKQNILVLIYVEQDFIDQKRKILTSIK